MTWWLSTRTWPRRVGPLPAKPRLKPDYEFFVKRVEPILSRAGADGKACVMCHASHAMFQLRPGHSQDNYRNALKVVNQAQPRQSLALIKPTRPNDSAGDPNLYLATHNGGERWVGNETSAEYQTMLEWIRGVRLMSGLDAGKAGSLQQNRPLERRTNASARQLLEAAIP